MSGVLGQRPRGRSVLLGAVGRVGHADDVAHAVLYLAGNGYATGTTVVVDGGHVIA